MLDIFKSFATDEKAELDGKWVPLDSEEHQILVARAGNKRYSKLLTQQYQKNKHSLDKKDDAAEALSTEIMIDAMARTLLLGWKGLSFQGKELQYSVDNAKLLLSVKDFRELVLNHSNSVDTFRVQDEAEAAKN